jgi:CheY-like chemotaxis protein
MTNRIGAALSHFTSTAWAMKPYKLKIYAQAIDQAIAQRPDVIVTDLWLPDMNAVDAAVAFKQDPFTSKIPVVVLTGMEDVRWKEKALQAGVIKYLVKPISLSELGAVVKSLG